MLKDDFVFQVKTPAWQWKGLGEVQKSEEGFTVSMSSQMDGSRSPVTVDADVHVQRPYSAAVRFNWDSSMYAKLCSVAKQYFI